MSYGSVVCRNRIRKGGTGDVRILLATAREALSNLVYVQGLQLNAAVFTVNVSYFKTFYHPSA